MGAQLTRILMVEDELDIQVVARMALEKVGGMTVEVCGSGREAIERAAAFRPDLILLDVMMPEMDGPTTLRALRGSPELDAVPVVFMTAKVQPHERQQYLELGALGVIAKPFAPLELPGALHELWEQHTSSSVST